MELYTWDPTLVECQRFLPYTEKVPRRGRISPFLCPLSPKPPIPEFVTPDHCAMSDLRLPSQLQNTGLVQLPFRWWQEADLAWRLLIFQYINIAVYVQTVTKLSNLAQRRAVSSNWTLTTNANRPKQYTRSSATADGSRDALCQSKSC